MGTIASNGENIASWRQSSGMRSRNLRSYGRQHALSACIPGRPVWGLLVVPLALSYKGSEWSSKMGPVSK